MTSPPVANAESFAYEAQTVEGEPISGTVDAADLDHAARQLAALRLRVVRIEPVRRGARPAPLRGEDFVAFNQQLAQLTAAGLPVEHGLRLIAQDMRSGRLRATVRAVADELDKGVALPDAFDRHKRQFPPLYGRLMEAGIRSHNLPGMLLNLGRHMELVHRLRGMIWRTLSYPLMVLAGLVVVLMFLSIYVVPQFEVLFHDFGMRLPLVTQVLLSSTRWMPPVLVVIAALVVLPLVLWPVLRLAGLERPAVEYLVLPLPLIGTVLRRNLVARWCDAMKLGVLAGLDLPAAIGLAGDAVGYSALRRDGRELTRALEAGASLDTLTTTGLIPPTVAAAIELSGRHNDLANALEALSQMFQQQAEMRLNLIPILLTPVLILGVATVIGFVILALFAPLLQLIQAVSGG